MSARVALASYRRPISAILSLCLCISLGCSSSRSVLRSGLERSAAKCSFASWNVRSHLVEPREASQSRALRIASLSNRELYRLMQCHPAPDLSTISGTWYGINKGLMPTMAGLMQDVKVLEGQHCVHGHNIMVKQVAIDDLNCRGWQPEIDSETCQPKTMGNFVVIAPDCCRSHRSHGTLGHALKFDYSKSDNAWYDPSRFLIDEIVQIDANLLLGRANAKVGLVTVPVAYFVLTRADRRCCSNQDASAYESMNSIAIEATPLPSVTAVPLSPISGDAAVVQDAEAAKPTIDTAPTLNDRAIVDVEVAQPAQPGAAKPEADENADSQPSASDRVKADEAKQKESDTAEPTKVEEGKIEAVSEPTLAPMPEPKLEPSPVPPVRQKPEPS